ncbi:hypothetical protein Tco_1546632 [Tanacetum coccineum]
MEDEHLNTISETESDEENESSIKDLNLTPSESEDLSEDLPIMKILLMVFSPKIDSLLEEFTLLRGTRSYRVNFIGNYEADLIQRTIIRPCLKKLKIDIFLAPDDSIPLGIENDDYDSEGDVLFLEELLNDDSISLPEYESFHVDFYKSSHRPPEKPPDDDVYFDIEPIREF